MNTEPVQTSELTAVPNPDAKVEKFTRHGMTFRLRGKKYTTRVRFRNKVHKLTLAETVTESARLALLARREITAGRWAQFQASTSLRAEHPRIALETYFTHYRAWPGHLAPDTKEKNIQALKRILLLARPEQSTTTLQVTDLTADLLWTWKQKVLEQTAGLDEERSRQLRRSANSTLRQARSLFTKDCLEWCRRQLKLVLPDFKKFCAEPGFKKVEKDDYHAPSDTIIAATLDALDAIAHVGPHGPMPYGRTDLTPDQLNQYKACWLALGFGLRASEIARAKNSDFKTIGGDIYFRPDWRAKNKRIPDIGVQLDAWQRLAPYIDTTRPDDYVLAGTLTERSGTVFRRISEWMRTLGWQTTHHVHELRAWAGCQITERHPQGLIAAQAFMRHSTYTTTQKFYGHHIKVRLEKVHLTIPRVTPFNPVVMSTPTAQAL